MPKVITEEQKDAIAERLIDRIEKANSRILKQMGNSIDEIGTLMPSDAYKLVQMLKYGMKYEKMIEELKDSTALNVKELNNIFDAYAKNDENFYKKFYNYRGVEFKPYPTNPLVKQQVDAIKLVAKSKMFNYSRDNVLGYTLKNPITKKERFYSIRETYNRLLEEALLNLGQGKATFDEAVGNIMEQIGKSGLKTLEYESGRSIRLDSAIRMHLKDSFNMMHQETQKIYGEEFDYDGIEITTHSFPAVDHAPVQGRQFEKEQFDLLQSGDDATATNGVTYNLDHDSKNGFRPIGTMNCYHDIFPIVLGVSKPLNTEEQLQKILEDNEKGFMYGGKHYTLYEGTQLQRKIERKIREQKDISILADAGNIQNTQDKAEKKIDSLLREYYKIHEISGLPTKLERLQVVGYRD